jgi:hypothetical protein
VHQVAVQSRLPSILALAGPHPRSLPAVAVVAIVLLTWAQPAAAQQQWNARQIAINRCEQELQLQMGREAGGRSPDAWIDPRRVEVNQNADGRVPVRGTGRFLRDANDRGREFTFECSAPTRGQVRATYRWTGPSFGDRYPDSADDSTPRPGGSVEPNGRIFFSGGIVNRNSGKCLDVEGRSNRNAANVQQWTCSGGSNQLWDIVDLGRGQYSIVSVGSNKVLEVGGEADRDGANIQQFRWQGGDNQRWRIQRAGNGAFQVVNIASDKCLDVENRGRDDGANVQQWACGGGTNQAWTFRK